MAVYNRFVVSQPSAGTTLIAAAVPGRKHKVFGFIMCLVNNNGTYKFTSSSGDLTGAIFQASNQPPANIFWHDPIIETALDSSLSLVTTSGAGRGIVVFMTEP